MPNKTTTTEKHVRRTVQSLQKMSQTLFLPHFNGFIYIEHLLFITKKVVRDMFEV